MENTENRDEIDENLYLGLPPLLPNPRWEMDISADLLNQARPASTSETPSIPYIETPILPFTPNFSLNENPPFPPYSSSHADPFLDSLSSTPALRISYRDREPSQQMGPMFLIPIEDLMNNGSRSSRVSNRDQLEEFPQLRFQRLFDLNRTSMGPSTVSTHPDTSPERLMNNILALEASRKSKLKGGRNGTAGTENNTDRCQCGVDFECNICLETAIEPVVTPCGHLFCWKCLYKWMKAQTIGITECPVCKGEVTENNLTPIYGRGGNGPIPGKVAGSVMEEKIPPRPSGRRTDSVRQLVRREVTGGPNEDLERVLVRLRQVNRSNRGTVAIFAGIGGASGLVQEEVGGEVGTGNGVLPLPLNGEGTESSTSSSVRGEVHVRRRRRYR